MLKNYISKNVFSTFIKNSTIKMRFSKCLGFRRFSTNLNDLKDKNQERIDQNSNQQLNNSTMINYDKIKGVKAGDSSHYIIQFTCKKCEHRTTRMFTKNSYHNGIVLIRCEGCENYHLIADNLGWFKDSKTNIEDIMKEKGEDYKKLTVDGLFQLSENDILEQKLENSKI
jgi:hypothetical protein